MAAREGMFSKIEGFNEVIANLQKEINAIEGRTMEGILDAVIIIHRAMETEEPKIPVDTANLRHSFFVTTAKGEVPVPGVSHNFKGKNSAIMAGDVDAAVESGKALIPTGGPGAVFGFSANYALAVHEMIGGNFTSDLLKYDRKTHKAKVTKRRAGAGAKFMESALNRHHDDIIQAIASKAKIE